MSVEGSPVSEPDIGQAVRRSVGIATLRRLRGMVDADGNRADAEARWARRLAWSLGIAFVMAVGWLAFR